MTLPTGWTTAAIDDLTIPKVHQAEPATSARYIDIGSIDRQQKRIGPVETVTPKTAPTRARQWVRYRDVLVSMTRPNLNAVALVPEELDGAVASTGFDVLRAVGVEPDWIFNRVRSQQFVTSVCKDVQGVVYPAIRPDDVRAHIMPVPPLNEQRRIVDAVDSYMTRLEAASVSLQSAHDKLKAYWASVLKAAVEGRLVPTEAALARAEKRDFEPADILLKRILAERRRRWEEAELAKLKAAGKSPKDDKWKAKYEDPEPPNTTNLPELPLGWCWVTTDQLAAEITDGDHQPPPVSEDGVPFLVIGNVRTGALDFSGCRKVPQSYYDKLDWKRKPAPGDILYTVVGSFGIPVRISDARPFCVQRHIAILKTPNRAIVDYLFYALSSGFVFAQASRLATGTAQKTLGLGPLRRIVIPLPPLAELARIVPEIQESASSTESVAMAINKDVYRVSRLRQAILKWAFEGKLVDQDPNDEPAEQLLERIRADRAKSAAPKRTRALAST